MGEKFVVCSKWSGEGTMRGMLYGELFSTVEELLISLDIYPPP